MAADLCDLALRSAVKRPTPRWQRSTLPSPHISRALSARTALPAALAARFHLRLPSQLKRQRLQKALPNYWLQRGPSPLPPPSHSLTQNAYLLIRSCHNLPPPSILTHALFAITPVIQRSSTCGGQGPLQSICSWLFPLRFVAQYLGHGHPINMCWMNESAGPGCLTSQVSLVKFLILCASAPLSVKMGLL